MIDYTADTQRRRIQNINEAERSNRRYFRRHRVKDYLPGQAVYNLGDYPARYSIAPTEYDYQLLSEMAQKGVELIQLHEDWRDSIRHLGGDTYRSFDPAGLQKFVDLCHSLGLKVIPYISSGYFQYTDPDFREEFVRRHSFCEAAHFNYIRCWAGSPQWREYLLPRTFEVLDTYGFDGIYNDWGYDGLEPAIAETRRRGGGLDDLQLPYDPELEDLLSLIYSEIKCRGGVYKIHADLNNAPNCKDKVCDYLWIGEGVSDETVGIGKDYEPYVVPCRDASRSYSGDVDFYFAKVIPFMQFPLLKRGRPLRGKGIDEDVPYLECSFRRKVKNYMEENPDGPYVYSLWSSVPDDPREYDRYCHYLSLYKPMVTENSVVYVELRDCADILSPLPEKVIASMFVNEKKYLVVSNLDTQTYALQLREKWQDRTGGTADTRFTIPPGTILFLEKLSSR